MRDPVSPLVPQPFDLIDASLPLPLLWVIASRLIAFATSFAACAVMGSF